MEVRPIDANALLTVPNVNKVTEYDETGCGISYNAVSVESIEKAPTLDCEPVRHGEWEKRTLWFGSWGENQMTCSECQKRYPFHAEYNYCPNCGVKMDGGK